MREFPRGGLIGRVVHAASAIAQLNIALYAANAGFFIVLSVFPALVLILSLLHLTGLQVAGLIEMMEGLVPAALMGTVQRIVLNTYRSTTGTVVGISALGTLWSASRGVHGLQTGLDAVYGVREDRGFLHTRLISMVYTFVLLLALLLTLVLHVFGGMLMELLPLMDGGLIRILTWILGQRILLLLPVQTLLFMLMYAFLPNGRNGIRDSIPGALLTSIGWLIFSDLYSVYVERYAGLTNIYGSVYAVALFMLWLYCCLSILFYGGALNAWLKAQNEKM